jgi:hypothetical protein
MCACGHACTSAHLPMCMGCRGWVQVHNTPIFTCTAQLPPRFGHPVHIACVPCVSRFFDEHRAAKTHTHTHPVTNGVFMCGIVCCVNVCGGVWEYQIIYCPPPVLLRCRTVSIMALLDCISEYRFGVAVASSVYRCSSPIAIDCRLCMSRCRFVPVCV